MKLTPLALASVLGLAGTACGGHPTPTSTPSVSTAVAAPSTVEVRRGLPTVPVEDGRAIPTVDANDAPPPPLATRTTLLEGNRPALVVTLPEAVLFAFGSAELRPEAEARLHMLVDLLRRHPGANAEVAGHTDSVGSADYNHTLSQRRAAAVVDWLVRHGVPRALLRPVGYGATRPMAGNATDEDRQRNRRVELTVRDT